MNKLYKVKTKRDLADALGIPYRKLTYMLYIYKIENFYESFEIDKKSGGKRRINAPRGDLLDLQRQLAMMLADVYDNINENCRTFSNISHGFEKRKSIITNAKMHKNKRYVLNLDISDYFDSFSFARVMGFFIKNSNFEMSIEAATVLAQLTCYEGKLPQGAPTSPIISNMICRILDLRIAKICKRNKVVYSRYADDLTISTNNKYFIENYEDFVSKLRDEIERFGLSINEKKTRLLTNYARQEVTGLVVNRKISIKREYCKDTRAMLHQLLKTGDFLIDKHPGTIRQLEGRFAFINQIDWYNNSFDGNDHGLYKLNSRERQYQKFLFYKYFYANDMPLVVTEGKTDIIYLKAALRKYHKKYPSLIEMNNGTYRYKVSFLKKSKRIRYFLGFQLDGADSMIKIYKYYTKGGNCPNYFEIISKLSKNGPSNPVILLFDNEPQKNKPYCKFRQEAKLKNSPPDNTNLSDKLEGNLYLLTVPMMQGKCESEMEDLFHDSVLEVKIGSKEFSRDPHADSSKYFGKTKFAEYVHKNFENIDFSNFVPLLDELNDIVMKFE
ncbi:MAG: retron Ec67 family RNA-directed DNA polymerase/endonuclease [Erysipelotrichaceae bacterium]|nr:retron Ec67 family RNA-directed DNA polymerase/endonuclease [Erysipelotrichaceae bacterium]